MSLSRLRWREIRTQLLRPRSWGPALAALVVLGAIDADVGLVAALLLFGRAVVWAVRAAPRRARDRFYAAYAEARGLGLERNQELPPLTTLLTRGDVRNAEWVISGALPGGRDGTLSLYTYQSYNNPKEEDVGPVETRRFTVVVHMLPKAPEGISRVHCEPRGGPGIADAAAARPKDMDRLDLESVSLGRRYQIYFSRGDNQNRLRRIFIPTFILWLAGESPSYFAFELSGRSLSAYLPGHLKDFDELDRFCEAAALVGSRIEQKA